MHKNILRKCLFPAAGFGTRFLPATKSMPKEMLPLVNKPLIQYGVEEALEANLYDIAIVTGKAKRAIEDFFDHNYELELQIAGSDKEKYLDSVFKIMDKATFSYTRQRAMKGLGDAILTGERLIGDEAFAVVLADDLCVASPGVLSQMKQVFDTYRCCVVAVQSVPDEEVHKYGIISGDVLDSGVYRVEQMVEKPKSIEQSPGNLAIIGRYILLPEIFDVLRDLEQGTDGEIQLTDALSVLANQGKVIAMPINGMRFDCGSVSGFLEASNYCYQHFYQKKE